MNEDLKRFLLYFPGIILIFIAGACANCDGFIWGWKTCTGEGNLTWMLIWVILSGAGILLNLRFITKEKQKILTQLKGGKTWKTKKF